jgi:hypothetical protein
LEAIKSSFFKEIVFGRESPGPVVDEAAGPRGLRYTLDNGERTSSPHFINLNRAQKIREGGSPRSLWLATSLSADRASGALLKLSLWIRA